ncbi:cytochrome c [Bradyrhizobium sp.]|uniref:c-type cytochrome n=1 Tax=Bradyrhizobium sp. TaxID=376 RepID=UPI002609AF55|nr:cytochrome c [Bradyrhizobium sp.]
MRRNARIHISLNILIAALLLAAGNDIARAADSVSAGLRLADAWCRACHAIEPHMAAVSDQAPSFWAVANRHGTTALSLKVFLRTSHQNMPNLVVSPEEADDLADYILSLKTE